MDKWEMEFKMAELLEEAKEQERFERFFASIPNLIARHKTQESHLPLIFITSADGKMKKISSLKEELN